MDADHLRFSKNRKHMAPFRRYLPPMGASSAKCGCGGHPQRNFLSHKVMNADWKENHQRLKEALVLHNRWKCHENAKELEKAREYAASGFRILPSSAPAFHGADGAAGNADFAAA